METVQLALYSVVRCFPLILETELECVLTTCVQLWTGSCASYKRYSKDKRLQNGKELNSLYVQTK